MSPLVTDGMLKVGGGFWVTHPLVRIIPISIKEISGFAFIESAPLICITSFGAKGLPPFVLNFIVAQRLRAFFSLDGRGLGLPMSSVAQ